MNRRLLVGFSLIIFHLSFSNVAAQTLDTTRVEQLGEVVVKAVKGQRNAPFAIQNIRKKDLQEFSKTGRELPFLFAQTPGVLAWSENGLGTGTTYMRIRGAAGSRINVTLDGVPLNSPEDQCVFWANMNSYGSLLGNVQIQRGVGSSTNGDGAFGGSISLETALPQLTPSGEVNFSYGSYNTMNWGGQFSTGLLWDHLILEGAYHQTTTDGFIHGTSGRSGNYYGGLSYVSDNFVVRYKNIGNFERTGQAWNGVTAGTNDLSIMDGTYGSETGIRTYADMWDKGIGRFNSLYEQLIINDDGTYSTERYKMSDGSYWDKTTDNFWQNHNLLSTAWTINDHWSTSASLHYTYGYGYYEEFRPNNKLSKFGLSMKDLDGNNIKRTDFVRKKGLTQHTYGLVASANYKNQLWDIIGGLSVQNFDGNHFGYLTYAAHPVVKQRLIWMTHPEINGTSTDLDVNYKYYDSDAHKLDGNVFVKALAHLDSHWDVFGDVQVRHVNYKTDGINDKFYDDDSGYYNQPLDINKHYTFFNPKAGFSYTFNTPLLSKDVTHRIYGSVAMSHREPERNNFTDNGSYPAPKAEQLMDYELGYTYTSDAIRFGANLYYMHYKDQFVQTGAQSDIGENLTTNIPKSYRMGVEMQLDIDITPWLTLAANTAISENKLKDFDEVVEDWDAAEGIRTIHYDDCTLAFSPSYITNAFARFHYQGLQAVWHTGMVSRQYLDNTQNRDRSLPSYEVSNISLTYTLQGARDRKESTSSWNKWFREMLFNVSLNNIFNKRYATSGWVYSAIYESGGHPNDNRYYQIGFIPAAGFTIQGGVSVKF